MTARDSGLAVPSERAACKNGIVMATDAALLCVTSPAKAETKSML